MITYHNTGVIMQKTLKKDEATPLPEQISNIIRFRIKSGEYQPGKKLGTIRQFASDFEVSPVTVIRALNILEEEKLIERVPIKGIFVSAGLSQQKKQLNVCFAFPEKEIAPWENAKETWGLNYELYRGLFTGAQRHKMNLQFCYFESNPTPELLESQKEELRKFDLVIFPGNNQLRELREASAEERLTFYFMNRLQDTDSKAIKVDYDRSHARQSLFEYFQSTGCRNAAALAEKTANHEHAIDFLKRVVDSGIAPADAELWIIDQDAPDRLDQLKAYLRRKPEFLFVHSTEFMPLVYEAAFDLGLTPGKDFVITGIASGMTFVSLFPRFSYFRIPRYEMGIETIRIAEELIHSGKKTGTVPQLKVEFINNNIKK